MTGGPPRRRETISFVLCLILYGGNRSLLLVWFGSFFTVYCFYTIPPIARWDTIRPERFPELRRAVEEGVPPVRPPLAIRGVGLPEKPTGALGADRDCQRHRPLAA